MDRGSWAHEVEGRSLRAHGTVTSLIPIAYEPCCPSRSDAISN